MTVRWIDDLDVPVEIVGVKQKRSWHLPDCPVCKRHLPGQHDQSTHGHGPGGVRQSLMDAGSVYQIAAATSMELYGITGRNIPVMLDHLEPQLAREYMEGVLRGAEMFPGANLTAITTADTSTYLGVAGRSFAHALPSSGEIVFDHTYSRGEIDRLVRMANIATIASSGRHFAGPEGMHATTGTHEFAHVVHGTDSNVQAATHHSIKAYAAAHNLSARGAAYTISEYAADSTSEALAEALVDVVYNGGGSELSQTLVAHLPGAPPASRSASLLDQRHLPGKHDQSTHGHGKGGVRRELADATTTREVAAAASAEAKRITGRDIEFVMEGSDVQVAREHSEGVLQGLERYPTAGLERVRTASMPFGYEDAWAVTQGGSQITFNRRYASDPTMYRRTLTEAHASGHLVTDNPHGVATHEFGHVLFHPGAGGFAGQVIAERAAGHAGESVSAHVEHHVSRYATSSGYELGAEAFTDVMLNGSSASALSHQVVEIEVKAAS